jgi:dipeptide/tripeptide permease
MNTTACWMLHISQTHAYPRAVAFIIGNEFCERFSFYGMRTILFVCKDEHGMEDELVKV